jgi:hypothetical protein
MPTSLGDGNASVVEGRGYFIGDYLGRAKSGSTFRWFLGHTSSGNLADRMDVFAATAAR